MTYLHRNIGEGFISVHDSKGIYLMKPGEEKELDQKSEGNGIIIIEKNEENETPPRIVKKISRGGGLN